MTKLLNHINTYADLTAYNNDMEKDFPNISYIKGTDEVKYSNPIVYATFDVTSSPTKILVTYNPAAFAKIELNGQEIELVDTNNYDFGAKGKYTLKYTLANETEITDKSWGWCYELIDISNIPKTVTSIGVSAFLGCKFSDFIIPNSVTSIGNYAFQNCNKLTNVTIGKNVITIGDYAFKNCTSLTSIDIPNSVTSIDNDAFSNCNKLTNVTIGKNVITIGDDAFYSCTSLTSIDIPDSVTSIGMSAFKYCSGLTSVTIGNGVTSIIGESFKYCSSLTSITIQATTPPTLGSYAFDSTNNCPIYVPAESVDAYKTASGWSSYADRIQSIS